MPSVTNLMGVGFGPYQAGVIATTPSTLTCTGTTSGTAATITTRMCDLNAASSQTGAIFPSTSQPGDVWYLSNDSGTTAVVYPISGATITGGSSLSIPTAKNAIVWMFSSTLFFHVILA